MANIYDESTWGNLPQEAKAKLIQIKQIMTKEDELRCATCNSYNCICGDDI